LRKSKEATTPDTNAVMAATAPGPLPKIRSSYAFPWCTVTLYTGNTNIRETDAKQIPVVKMNPNSNPFRFHLDFAPESCWISLVFILLNSFYHG